MKFSSIWYIIKYKQEQLWKIYLPVYHSLEYGLDSIYKEVKDNLDPPGYNFKMLASYDPGSYNF